MQMRTPPTCRGATWKKLTFSNKSFAVWSSIALLAKTVTVIIVATIEAAAPCSGIGSTSRSEESFMKEWKVQNEWINIGGSHSWQLHTHTYTLQSSIVCKYVCHRCAWRCTELLTQVVGVLTKCSPKPWWTAAGRITRAVESSIQTETHILACMQERSGTHN